ncbi:hypothetical protein R50072_26390 [Simiduia litorea]|uniref:FG-GAP-like repeat-containing protein n=1 Tax=Simiduia litorea TaxID=1435348 RepID=UPI0036F1D950
MRLFIVAVFSILLSNISFGQASTVPLSGQFRVSEQGAATYTLPIPIPSARGGLQPQVSISYSSGGSGGPLGIGFQLSAGSAVTRCPSTIAQDGQIKGVELTANDRFCLDGQRLVLISGSYGANGSLYRKELDDFSIITALGQAAGGGPIAFSVSTKSGDTHYYGAVRQVLPSINLQDTAGNADAGDAKFSVVNRAGGDIALSWSIKGTVDAVGNFISYQYGLDLEKGEQWLASIASGGHLGSNSRPYVKATFQYEDLPKPRNGFIAGVAFSQSKLLNGIQIHQDDQFLDRHILSYSKSDVIEEQIYLTQIQRCVSEDLSDCSTPVVFEWNKPDQLTVNGTVQVYDDETGVSLPYTIPTSNFTPFSNPAATSVPNSNRYTAQAFDMTGDGKGDLIYVKNGTWYLSSFDGSLDQSLTSVGASRAEHAMSINYDGDGQRDLLVSDQSTGNWQVISFKPSQVQNSFCEPAMNGASMCENFTRTVSYTLTNLGIASHGYDSNAMVADVNGDGLEDILFVKDKAIQWYKNNGGTFSSAANLYAFSTGFQASFRDSLLTERSANLKTGAAFDANGDGRTDLLLKITSQRSYCKNREFETDPGNCRDAGGTWTIDPAQTNWKLFVAGGTLNSPSYTERQNLSNGSIASMRAADINGDGISDLLYYGSGKWYVRLGNGYNFNAPKDTNLTATQTEADRSQFIDLNGDGRADMLKAVGSSSFHIFMSRPMDSANSIYWQSRGVISMDNSRVLQFSDTHGEGRLDLYSADGSKWYRHASRMDEFESLVTSITEGYGVKTSIQYSRLTKNVNGSPEVYKTQASSAESEVGNFSFLMPMVVVKQVDTEVTDSATLGVAYEYGGLLINRLGRGMLGFEMLRTKDLQTGVVSETVYHQSFPKVGVPLATVQLLGAQELSRSENTYQVTSAYPDVYAVHSEKTTEISRQIGSDGVLYPLSKIETRQSQIDTWGNVGLIEVDVTNLATGQLESSVSTTSEYLGLGGGAEKGRLSKATVTKQRFGQRESTAAISRVSDFTYYDNGLLHTSTTSPGDAQLEVATSQVYDQWGNVTLKTVRSSKDAAGTVPETRSVVYQYDSRGRYLASEANALNETATYQYNQTSPSAVTGLITHSRVTDANAFYVDSFKDRWGRTARSVSKDGVEAVSTYALCSNVSDCGDFTGSIIVETKTATGKPTEQAFYDRFGRALGSRHQGFGSGSWVYKKTTYDNKGRASRHYEPTFNGPSQINFTEISYDLFDRISQQTMPNNGVQQTTYAGLTTTVTDNLGGSTTYTNNALGDKAFVDDALGNRLEYLYDGYGNLLKVWAKAANLIEVVRTRTEFDAYGRKLATVDLDKGRWTYTYSGFGELLSQTTANGDVSRFEYDLLGRKIKRLEPEGVSCWTYGNITSGDVGRLLKETSYLNTNAACGASGFETQKSYGYDAFGRMTSTSYQYGTDSYTVGFDYDTLSRLSTTTYPNNALTVKNEYNLQGYLYRRVNLQSGLAFQTIVDMDARGNATQVNYGNGTEEVRDHKADTGWLKSITLQRSTLLHKLEYQFDSVGNLEWRKHNLSIAQASWTEDFLYDDLYRLEDRVITVGLDGLSAMPASFKANQTFSYDDWGNIKSKSGTGNYQYDTVNPYRLINICEAGPCSEPLTQPASQSCPAGYAYDSASTSCKKAEVIPASIDYSYSCPAGYTLNAATNDCRKTETSAATPSYSYSCAAGYTYNVSAGNCQKAETKAASASATPTCQSGYSYNSATSDCRKTETQAASVYYTYTCASGYSYNSSTGDCRKNESTAATVYYTYSCAAGYSLSGTTCSKIETVNATASTTLSCPSGYSYHAASGMCRKFQGVIAATKPSGSHVVSCFGGEPMGGGKRLWECTFQTAQVSTTTYSCSAGWSLSGTSCSRTLTATATQNTNYQCSSGWSLSGSTCSRTLTATATQNTNYQCSSGWNLSGSSCSRVLTATAGSQTTYSCDSGWSLSGTSCNRTLSNTATQNVSYSCASGWSLSGSQCSRVLVQPQIVEAVNQCPSGYSYNAGADNCQKQQTQAASSSINYSCPVNYSLSGTSCSATESKAATVGVSYSCPAGYSYSATTGMCRKFQGFIQPLPPTGSNIESCSGGEPMGNGNKMWECWVQTPQVSQNTYSCDAGWSLSGTTCSRTLTQAATPNTVYQCDSGWSLNGTSCNRTLSAAASDYYCAAGWALNGSNCNRTLTAAATFACPAGWSLSGSQCQKAKPKAYDFVYDAQGNVLNDGKRSFEYTSYDLASRISNGAQYSTFKYDAGRARYQRFDNKLENGQMAAYSTTYVDGMYEKVERTGGGKASLTEHKYYVGNAVITLRSDSTSDTFYIHKDHQGSTTTVTDAGGQAVQQFLYDPWGKQTHAFTAAKLNDVIGPAFTRGYTGHEMLDHVDIIHMNGRIYDANIGRFMQADPFIQSPTVFQNYNRYSYVQNNPMSYSDPSGFFLKKLFKAIAKIPLLNAVVQIVLAVYCQVCLVAYNAMSTYAVTGSLKAGIIAGIASAITPMGGGSGSFVQDFVVQGVIGGISSVLQGGKFGNGFVSAGISSLGGAARGAWTAGIKSIAGRAMASALIGGTVSQLTGGKFANGAAAGAFRSWLNDPARMSTATERAQKGIAETERQGANPLSVVGDVLKRIWALPNTIIGAVYGGIGMIFGATPVWDSDAGILRFTDMPTWMMPSAMSFGHVQVFGPGAYKNPDGTPALNRFGVSVVTEETLHTRQAEVLGPLYLPLHAVAMSASLLSGGGTHNNNVLEMGPERGRSPWPWSR